MISSEKIGELATALAEVQKKINNVFKSEKGYGYSYAPLDKVYDEVRPLMAEHGLSLTHEKRYEGEVIVLTSLLMHTSGEWIRYEASIPFARLKGSNDYQSAGAGFTYLERYQTSAIFAITADEDIDAAGEQVSVPISEIESLIRETNTDMGTFLAWVGAKSIDTMTEKQKEMAKKALIKKRDGGGK